MYMVRLKIDTDGTLIVHTYALGPGLLCSKFFAYYAFEHCSKVTCYFQ